VRSARQYYIAWAAEWKAVYVHAGGSPQALATLAAKGRGQYVYNADEFRFNKIFRRIPERFAPHNLYSSLPTCASSRRRQAKPGPMEAKWKFAPDLPLEQRPVGVRSRCPTRPTPSRTSTTATPIRTAAR
jgi:hypothetical protein